MSGGVVLRIDGELRFVPASVAVRIIPAPRVTAVPGAPQDLAGIAMHEGNVVPVLAVGPTPAGAQMIVCQHAGELLGLVGAAVVHAGSFQVSLLGAGGVQVEGRDVPPLDLGALYDRVRTAARSGRWVG